MREIAPIRSRLAAVALAAMVCIAVAPTLPLLEFSNGAEGLNVSTALEIRRSGNWLTPTLGGEPRIAKPPLTGWITASVIGNATFKDLSSSNQTIRHRAFNRLAFQVRLPALIAACIMLYAIFELGRILVGARAGLISLIVAASALLWLRFSRYATTDVQLAMWVTIANVGLVIAIFHDRWWKGCMIAGIALGFAFMSKGPVCFVQTIVPGAIFLVWRWWLWREPGNGRDRSIFPAIGAGALVMLLIAVPWFAIVAIRQPTALSTWFVEVTREGATDQEPDRWYSYLSFILFMAPWVAFFIAGIVLFFQRLTQREAQGLVYAGMMLLTPILIMSLFRDRQIRYLLPLIGPAAIVTAAAILEWWKASARDRFAQFLGTLHWMIVAVIAVGFPLAACGFVSGIQRFDGQPWYSRQQGITFAILGAVVILIGIVLQRRWRGALLAATLIIMLGMQAVFMHGYRASDRGRADMRPLADLIANEYPSADVFTLRRARPDMSIYLNRTVRFVRDSQSIARSDYPQILLAFQRKNTDAPSVSPDWQFIGQARRNQDWWYAYIRQSASH